MADESTGFGSTFSMGNPVTLLELANIEEFPDLPSFTRDLLDTTNFKTVGGFMTYMGSPLKDGAESDLVMKIALGSPSDVACRLAMSDGMQRPYLMVLPTANDGTWEVSGNLIVRNYVRTNPKADIRLATLTVKWSGIATEEAGS
ncbi:hypothetical protein U1769_24160 [Sphingomonas sp. ZT3P38]|uniref:hypothetical protein n=1 Tax=Parasphingomonas zepuensis TaxID=3096161 RepID=UPI002FC71B15